MTTTEEAVKAFADDLVRLINQHKIFPIALQGHIALRHLPDSELVTHEIKSEVETMTGTCISKVRIGVPFFVYERKDPPAPEPEPFVRGRAPIISGDIRPYQCPVTGRMVDGRADHKENLKRTGSRIMEPGEMEEFRREKPKREAEAISKATDKALTEIAGSIDL